MHATLSQFTFGAEFEVLLPRHIGNHEAAAAVARASGLSVTVAGRAGIATQWKVVSDISVSGRGLNGMEFVSPILKGENGLEQVRKICAALTSIGATINTTCGLHVHVGVNNEPVDFFKSLIKLYGKFEDAIDTIMPVSRRANSAQYCKSVKLSNPALIESVSTKEELALRLARASGADGAKYHKVNLVPHGKPTVEFRHHAGTVDGEKAVNWITVCLRLVLAAKMGKTGDAGVAAIARDFSRLDAKARAVAEAISRPEGATADEIRAAHGFRALSVNRQAAIAGLQVRVVRERGKDRFFIVAQTEPGRDVPATLDGLVEVIDCSPEEIAFLRGRAQRLASL